MINNGIEYLGRFDLSNPSVIKFAWSGSTIKASFYGTSVKAKLASTTNQDYVTVIVDDEVVHHRFPIQGEGFYVVADQLPIGKHTIELVKRTELTIGTISFFGFDFGSGFLIEKDETNFRLKVEIIGDSLTCGFGNEGDLSMNYDPKYDNAYLSYGMIAARNLNADIRLICCSGYGLIRNYSGDTINTMPTMIDKITPSTASKWDNNLYVPHVVVINLGTNDFSGGYIPERTRFVSAYIQLVNRILKQYKDVNVLCTVGPAVTGEALQMTKEYVNEVVNHFQSHVFFLEYATQCDGFGIAYHPNLITHQKMANTLVEKIKEII